MGTYNHRFVLFHICSAIFSMLTLVSICVVGQSLVPMKTKNKCTITKLPDHKSEETCGTGGYTMQCSSLQLEEIPTWYPKPNNTSLRKLCFLDLSNNRFTTIPNNSFIHLRNMRDLLWLNLSINALISIDSDAFVGLNNLLYVNLTENHLSWPGSFGKRVFAPLRKLKQLNIKHNNISTFDGMDHEMQYLKNLEGLFLNGCPGPACTFGPGFRNLTKLVNVSMSGRTEDSCNMNIVSNETFVGLPQIQQLWIASCHVTGIGGEAFAPFKDNIKLLDISYNEKLTFNGMNTALYGLRNSSTLKELNVNRIHSLYERGTILLPVHVENMRTLGNLETLHMDLNKLEVFDKSLLYPKPFFPKSLWRLTLTGNRLTSGAYAQHLFSIDNLKVLDLSRQHLNLDPFRHNHFESDPLSNNLHMRIRNIVHERDPTKSIKHDTEAVHKSIDGLNSNMVQTQTYTKSRTTESDRASELPFDKGQCPMYQSEEKKLFIPPNLQRLYWNESFLYIPEVQNIRIYGGTHLKHLDLALNLIQKWCGPIAGFENLNHLDLSQNLCDEVSPYFFSKFYKLKHLYIFDNALGQHLHELIPNANKTFENLTMLEMLDMSLNKISSLPETIFYNLRSLKFLDLSKNQLWDWNVHLDNSPSLTWLDLSENKLKRLPKDFTMYLDSLAENYVNTSTKITVNLGNNPIECSCHSDAKDFFTWLSLTKVQVNFSVTDQCLLPDGKTTKSLHQKDDWTEIAMSLEEECMHITWIIVLSVAAGTCVFSILFCILIYRYRWKLRHLYYSKRNRRHKPTGYDSLFENDAFMSYSENISSLIKSKFVPALEKDHRLKIWVADRDSQAGASIAENIVHAICTSRKSVLLINKAFLKDSWCDYEMNMANVEAVEGKRKVIVIVLMDQLSIQQLPINIMRLLRDEVSIEYPDHPQHLDIFWNKLAEAITTE